MGTASFSFGRTGLVSRIPMWSLSKLMDPGAERRWEEVKVAVTQVVKVMSSEHLLREDGVSCLRMRIGVVLTKDHLTTLTSLSAWNP